MLVGKITGGSVEVVVVAFVVVVGAFVVVVGFVVVRIVVVVTVIFDGRQHTSKSPVHLRYLF